MNQTVTVSLVGMPSVGKSTLGVVLAKALAKPFIDTDLLIQQALGNTLQAYLDNHGYLALRAQEEQVLLAAELSGAVVATGGSVVYSAKSMQKLKALGPVVYLQASLADIEKRMHNFAQRGVASAPGMTLEDIYVERTGLYEQYADIICDTSALVKTSANPIEAAVTEILAALERV